MIGIAIPGDLERMATFAIAKVLCKPVRSNEMFAAMTSFYLPEGGRASVVVID